jgi:hypothetical protein
MHCKVAKILNLVSLALLGACATYVPPPPATPESFSRDLPGSYDRTWSAVTYVAGASSFKIKAFEKASGLMTVDFDLNDVTPYVDCGTAQNNTTHRASPALLALGFTRVSLEGRANINIRSQGANRTAIQFNSHYTLSGFRPDGVGGLARVAGWTFNSGSSDTQSVGVTPVTCRSSYKIERDFLSEVAARL